VRPEKGARGAATAVEPDADYWDGYWSLRQRENDTPQEVRADKRAVFDGWIPRGSRVLEIGCGSGRYLKYLETHLGCEAWGVDYSETGLALARSQLTGTRAAARMIEGDFFAVELPGVFDVTLGMGLLEHFTPDAVRRLLERRLSVTRPRGLSIDMVPNYGHLWGIRRRRFKRAGNALYTGEINEFVLRTLARTYRERGLVDLEFGGEKSPAPWRRFIRSGPGQPLPGLTGRNIYVRGRVPAVAVSVG